MVNSSLENRHVLITGGTGFIGSRLALRLLAQGLPVRVLGQVNTDAEQANLNTLQDAGAHVVIGSVEDRQLVATAVQGIDIVYHLAAAQHEANVPDQHFWNVNVSGTQNMLDASVDAGISRFVYGSTIGVYGSGAHGRIDEQTPLRPDNVYGITKARAEGLVRSYTHKLPVVIIRISETYGPGDRRLLKLFRGVAKGRFPIIGNGRNLHHLIYVDDLIQGLLLAATARQAVGNTFLLAGEEPITTNEMVNTVAREVGGRVPFRAPLLPFFALATVLETALRPLGIQPPLHRRRMDFFRKSFAFSIDCASEALGFRPQISFNEGVAKTAQWYREMGYLSNNSQLHVPTHSHAAPAPHLPPAGPAGSDLSARLEPFDSFWEGPDDVEKGYDTFGQFYRHNYLKYIPPDKEANILIVSCGPGYFVNLLQGDGYHNVLGIDSYADKIAWAQKKGLNCQTARAFPFLEQATEPYDAIICEQELNHLTKQEMVDFLHLCHQKMAPGGTLIVHGLNGANPITGADAAAQNFDHFNTFTEYSLSQVLDYCGFKDINIIPLNLYVFYNNPLNYVASFLATALTFAFRASFALYGKSNKTFTKKIGGICKKGSEARVRS